MVVLSWSVSQVDWAQASREAQERAGMDVKQVLAARPSFLPPARLYRPGLLWIGDDRCHVTSKPGRLQHTGELGRLIAPRWTLLRARFVLPTQLSVPTPPTHPHNAHERRKLRRREGWRTAHRHHTGIETGRCESCHRRTENFFFSYCPPRARRGRYWRFALCPPRARRARLMEQPLLTGISKHQSALSRWSLLAGSAGVFFVQFAALGMPAPFLPTSPTGLAVGTRAVGLIFSAYPLGTVLAGPVVPRALESFGARAVVCSGLVASAISSLAFGLVPWALSSSGSDAALTSCLATCRLSGGAAAAACETGSFTALSLSDWGAHMGKVFAAVEVDIGLALSLGAALGGWLYRAAGTLPPDAAFALPFAAIAAAQLLLVPFVAVSIPGKAPRAQVAVSPSGVWTPARIAIIFSVVAWGALNEGIQPILGPHLAAVAGVDAATVGFAIAFNSLLYMLSALPMGLLVDLPCMARRRTLTIAAGWAVYGAGHIFLGPGAAALGPRQEVPLTRGAMGLLGVASSACIVPTMPELRTGLAEEAIPRVSAVWTTAFSLGALLGPLASSELYASLGFDRTCELFAATCALVALCLLAAARPHGRLDEALDVPSSPRAGLPPLPVSISPIMLRRSGSGRVPYCPADLQPSV